MKVKSFGCSFIYGSDLADCPHGEGESHPGSSQLTWPALMAKDLGLVHECHAWPGVGNLRILERILYELSKNERDLYVISWTWIDRFDYVVHDQHPWQAWAWSSIMPMSESAFALHYYKNHHCQIKDQLTSLIYISQALQALRARQMPFIMTYMDPLIMESQFHGHPWMHDSQQDLARDITLFDGMTFLEWSRDRGHDISTKMHPLESAHAAAARQVMPLAERLFRQYLCHSA